jgi:hypothetical protein
MIQRAILCFAQQCSASGARWLASSTTTGANRQCGRALAGGYQRAKLESVKDHEGTPTHKEAANLQMNQSDMKEAGVIKAFDEKGPHAGKFSVKYKDDPNWWTHSLFREGYGKDKHWVLLGLPSRDSA